MENDRKHSIANVNLPQELSEAHSKNQTSDSGKNNLKNKCMGWTGHTLMKMCLRQLLHFLQNSAVCKSTYRYLYTGHDQPKLLTFYDQSVETLNQRRWPLLDHWSSRSLGLSARVQRKLGN